MRCSPDSPTAQASSHRRGSDHERAAPRISSARTRPVSTIPLTRPISSSPSGQSWRRGAGDPPYLHATRRSARRYRFDYEEVDHVALLDLLKDLPCQVMVSGHPSALYDEMLAGWRSLALQVTTQAQVRTEVVWFNFAPDRVHWASYAGRNFTDRQRIKRKAANWGRRYKALPAGERLAVLAA